MLSGAQAVVATFTFSSDSFVKEWFAHGPPMY